MLFPEKFAALPPDQRPQFILGGIAILAVLVTIASTCFFPKVRPLTLRILGAIGIASCVFSIVEGFHTNNFSLFRRDFLFLFASIYLVVKGKLTY